MQYRAEINQQKYCVSFHFIAAIKKFMNPGLKKIEVLEFQVVCEDNMNHLTITEAFQFVHYEAVSTEIHLRLLLWACYWCHSGM